MLCVDAIPAHWSQGKVKILVYVLKECHQAFELKNEKMLRRQIKQLATIYSNNHKNRSCLPFVKITLPVCKSSWIQLEDEKVNPKDEARGFQYLSIHSWVLSRDGLGSICGVCVTLQECVPGGAADSVCEVLLSLSLAPWRILFSALCFSCMGCINISTAVLLTCTPRTDWGGLLEGKIHSVVKERCETTCHAKDELSTTCD